MKHTQQGGNGAYQAKSLGLEVRLPSSHVLELGTSQTRSVCGVGVGVGGGYLHRQLAIHEV